MSGRCPGQDSRNLTVSLPRCPECLGEVEMFSDEARVRCPWCGAYVTRQALPSCVEWCASVRQCVGEATWQAFQQQRGHGR